MHGQLVYCKGQDSSCVAYSSISFTALVDWIKASDREDVNNIAEGYLQMVPLRPLAGSPEAGARLVAVCIFVFSKTRKLTCHCVLSS